VNGSVRPGLSLVPDEPDQVLRLNQFRAQHPGIAIRAGLGYWQALLPECAGEIVVTRYQLKELLDRLDALTSQPVSR
jgi:hypothetical protein